MERQLATIQRILDINPIPDAEAIERVTVKGWNVVSEKNIHKIGDLAIYIEIDSIIPIYPEFEFLRKSSYRQFKDGTEGFLLRTVTMRGQVSQGLLLPLSIIQNITNYQFHYNTDSVTLWNNDDKGEIYFKEGDDITQLLGITKYEEPIPDEITITAKGMSPSFVPDSSLPRAQNSQDFINRYAGETFRQTEKLDGWAVSYYLNSDVFGVCSRGVDFKEIKGNPYWDFAKKSNLEERLRKVLDPGTNIVLQGELIGEGIAKNKYKLKGKTVRFYNCRSHTGEDGPVSIILQVLNFQTDDEILLECPVINENYTLPSTVEQLVQDATIRSILNPAIWAEGYVLKHKTISRDFKGKTSLKVINPNFLLKYNE